MQVFRNEKNATSNCASRAFVLFKRNPKKMPPIQEKSRKRLTHNGEKNFAYMIAYKRLLLLVWRRALLLCLSNWFEQYDCLENVVKSFECYQNSFCAVFKEYESYVILCSFNFKVTYAYFTLD